MPVEPTPSPAAASSAASFAASDFSDVDAFLRLPRLTAVATGPGDRVVAAVGQADEHGSRLVSSLWELDPAGEPAHRLTFSEKGETAPRFAPDGSLLFSSARPDPQGEVEEDVSAIWRLPVRGEAHVVAWMPGGLTILATADDGTILASTSVLPGSSLADDAERRKARADAKQTTIWHTGMPVRYWDREVGDASPRLVVITPEGDMTDLADDADTLALRGATADISPDGSTVVTTWDERIHGGETRTSLVRIDTATRERTVLLAADARHEYDNPVISGNGARIAVTRLTTATPADTTYPFLEIHRLDSRSDGDSHDNGTPVTVDLGNLTVSEYTWTPDDALLVTGDRHSSGAVLTVDGQSGDVRTLADDAVYSSLAPAPDGSLFALRSDVATPPRPVRLDADDVCELPAPGTVADLPGRLEWVETDIDDDLTVGGWLCIPTGATADNPAPVMLWIHGGPHSSYNAWSWRWCPWLSVARGYAVLMPDPAMSTGYGHAGLNRGWPRLPDIVFDECERLLDDVLERPELDSARTALLGASFGGYMTNWVAGNTDRFDAIVTHAGLWALDQQHRTTDAAAGKMRVHGHEDQWPDWYRAYSPHHGTAKITTPMLITHGNRDYRVPISEALRLWWDLVSTWDGPPETMPHRFLQLTSENHWVLTPSNSRAWNETVLAFCDQHVRGGTPVPDVLPW